MNKIYNIIWNESSNQWVVASELVRTQGNTHSQSTTSPPNIQSAAITNTVHKLSRITASVAMAVIATLGSSFIATQAMAAECAGVVNSYVEDSSGTTCDVSGTSYDHIQGHNAGTVINVAAPNVTVAAGGSFSYATGVDNDAIINFAGNLDSTAYGSRHSVSVGYPGGQNSTMNIAGNLTTTTDGGAGESIYILGGNLTVGGNVIATVGNDNRDVIRAFGNMTVKGSTTVTSALANGMTLGGKNDFGGPVTVNIAGNNKTGINFLWATNSLFKKDLVVNTAGANSTAINTLAGSNATVVGSLSISTQGNASNGIANAGNVIVQGNTTIDTSGLISSGINNTAGTFTALGNSSINTTGDSAVGVKTTGGTTSFNKLTVNTSGSSSDGVIVDGAGATTTLGAGSSITTTSGGAKGVIVENGGQLNFATGDIHTSGNSATGLYFSAPTNGTPYALNTGANITTTGDRSHGVELWNGIQNVVLNGDISTSGTDSRGISVIGTQALNLTTGGNLNVAEAGIVVKNQSGDVTINTATGKTITANGGSGIVVDHSSSPNITINNNSVINSKGYGITARGDMVTINNTANITVTSGGRYEGGSNCGEYGNYGIEASSCAGKDVTITSSGKVSAENGISAKTKDEGDILINVSGDVTATAGKGIIVQDSVFGVGGIGTVNITTASGTTVQATDNAIDVTTGQIVDWETGATTGGGPTTITNAASLISSSGNGIDVTKASGGSTITNSGDINATTADKFVIAGGDAIETVTTTAGTLTGNTDLGAGNDTFTASGGTLVGNTLMGDGDDLATLTGTIDVTAAPQFDGGIGTDVLNVDGIALRGFTAANNDGTGNLTETNNSNLTGWETINVKNAGTLKLSNNLFTSNNNGTLNIDETSTLDLKGNSPGIFTIFGDVNNSGIITMQDGAADDVTTITGNYSGVAGSQFNIDTVLGDDSSLTDKLIVNGKTSGATAVAVTNVGGAGAQTVEGIQVVQVDGASDGTFSLAAPVQAGSYEYTLQKNGVSTPTDGDWYLRSTFVATCANTPSLCPIDPVDPVDPIDPVDPPKPPVYIYRPGVAAYVTAQSANADAGFLQMLTLHQRMGEQRDLPTDKPQTWGRLIGAGVSNSGKSRFEYDQFTTGFQFGHDLLHSTDKAGTQQRAGVTLQYAHSSMDAKDRVRPLVGLGEDTGSMSSNSIGLGGYYTRMNQAGAYLDVVSQVNHLSNKFADSYGGDSKQKGWQFGLSAEVGKPVADLGGWKFEPQAQLSYLHTRYDDFSDQYSYIAGLNVSQLRGRLGLRMYKDFKIDNRDAQYYGIVNVHHDFLKPKEITLHDRVGNGSTSVRESYDRTFGEIGLGIQGQVAKSTYIYADARYQRSFKGNKEGAQFNIGIKTSF